MHVCFRPTHTHTRRRRRTPVLTITATFYGTTGTSCESCISPKLVIGDSLRHSVVVRPLNERITRDRFFVLPVFRSRTQQQTSCSPGEPSAERWTLRKGGHRFSLQGFPRKLAVRAAFASRKMESTFLYSASPPIPFIKYHTPICRRVYVKHAFF